MESSFELSTSYSLISTEEISRLKRRSWREREYGRGMGMRSKLLPIWVHLAKSEKTNAQSGLAGLGEKRIVAHFQVPSALASVAISLERASQVPRIPTCLLK